MLLYCGKQAATILPEKLFEDYFPRFTALMVPSLLDFPKIASLLPKGFIQSNQLERLSL
jgi:hypothetical protein